MTSFVPHFAIAQLTETSAQNHDEMTSQLLWILMTLATLMLMSIEVTATKTKTPTWPALRLHFTLKRSSMNIYGQSDFSMYANPIVSDNEDKVLYDVFATFQKDQTIYNYRLVDGAAYISTTLENSATPSSVECLHSETGKLPPVNAIVGALNDATVISSASTSDERVINCPSKSLFKVTINSIDFVLCSSGSSGFTMYGSDMDIDVQYLESHIDIKVPISDSKKCSTVATPNPVTSIGKSLLTGEPIGDATRNLKVAFGFKFQESSSCSCKSIPRPCIFIHGLGVEDESSQNVDSLAYWGDDLTGRTPCCSSVKFSHLNTVKKTWTSRTLQEKVCNRALAVSNTSTESVISDTIVVTHSMGNVMFAGALAKGRCSLDSSSTWVGMGGPMTGSMASDFVQKSCRGESHRFWKEFGDITGECPPTTGLRSLAYQNGNFSSRRLDAAYEAAQEAYRTNVSALMCGAAYGGITSAYQPRFWILGRIVPHKSKENDGMVEFQSCAHGIPESKFGDNWRNRFYKTKLNHYDMQFKAGDAILDGAKMPVKWFECLL